jgi:hypothetical protein
MTNTDITQAISPIINNFDMSDDNYYVNINCAVSQPTKDKFIIIQLLK